MGLALAIAAVPASADDRCVPHARVTGDTLAVDKVVGELRRLGVAIGSGSPGCPAVEAAVAVEGDGLAVAVEDATHRSEGRVVGDAAIAAAWIDSWLHDDGLDPWGSAPPPKVRVAEAPGATPPVAARVVVEPKPRSIDTPQRSALLRGPAKPDLAIVDRLAIAVDAEQTWTNDGRAMQGISGGACVEVGGVCVGARASYASLDFTQDLVAASRSDLALYATAAASFAVGSMRITPEVGVGISRVSTTRIDGCMPPVMPNCMDPNDPTCSMPPDPGQCTDPSTGMPKNPYVGDGLSVSTYAPRALASVRIAVPLFSHVWLDGRAAITGTVLGHTEPFTTASMAANVPSDQLAIPGEPDVGYTLGVGIRVEAP